MIQIDPFNKSKYDEIRSRWDSIAKPLDSLGRFEDITARIGAIHDSDDIDIRKRAVIIMCADNGIVEEGVSQSGQDVTAAVAGWMGRRESSVCRMAKAAHADIIPVDIGINSDVSPKGVIDRKVMKGTRNFAHGPAMTEDECMQAVDAGIDMVCECSVQGYKLLATGEMGIGNTTTSSVLAAALLGLDASSVTGRGAGLNNDSLKKKTAVIQDALDRYCNDGSYDRMSPEFALHILSCAGGLDIAGLAGVFIGGAICHIPIIIDGFISAAAALVAERLVPGARDYMIASHIGKEPGMKYLLDTLGLEPVIDAGLALGEGTGAVMLMPLLDTALALYSDGLNFEDTTVDQYQHFDSELSEGETILIIGYPGSGKSALAEKTVTEISSSDERIYLAAMIPYGQEGMDRIERHRRQREGKGFITVEAPFDICEAVEMLAADGSHDLKKMTLLIECVSNITANEMFERHTDRKETVIKVCEDIRRLSDKVKNLVIVSNHFEKEDGFDKETAEYADTLDEINDILSGFADKTIRL